MSAVEETGGGLRTWKLLKARPKDEAALEEELESHGSQTPETENDPVP